MNKNFISATDFFKNKPKEEAPDLHYVLTNYKRKGLTGDIIDLYITKRVPYDLKVVAFLDADVVAKLTKLMEESRQENISLIKKFLPLKKTTKVEFKLYYYGNAIKVSFQENTNPEFLTIEELKMLGPQQIVLFEANPFCTTKEEYQLLYILTLDTLIITKENKIKHPWILSIIQEP